MSDKIRKYVLPNLPYLFVFWFFSKIGTAYRIYNPLAYIKTESDVLKFVTALIANTKGARPDRA